MRAAEVSRSQPGWALPGGLHPLTLGPPPHHAHPAHPPPDRPEPPSEQLVAPWPWGPHLSADTRQKPQEAAGKSHEPRSGVQVQELQHLPLAAQHRLAGRPWLTPSCPQACVPHRQVGDVARSGGSSRGHEPISKGPWLPKSLLFPGDTLFQGLPNPLA